MPTTPVAITVKTVRPKRNASLEVTVEQPAYVEGYYHADLLARVAGPVTFLEKAIGDKVEANEELLKIDVPDLKQDVEQKKTVVAQRKREKEVAEAMVRIAQAVRRAADQSVEVSKSRAKAATEERIYRGLEYDRYKQLAAGNMPSISPAIVDEKLKWFNVAKANEIAGAAEILKATADQEEAQQKVEAAQADVNLKESLIKVAEADQQRSQALLDLATLRAPFKGVITRRSVDPGNFAHNAATAAGHTEPLLSVDRTDIVTVYMKVPEKYAPFVSSNTEAFLSIDALRGVVLRTRISRYSNSLQTPEHDRSMRVEVDLFNGSPDDYQAFVEREKTTKGADLKGRAMPFLPTPVGGGKKVPELLPGMYGKMRLVLRKFTDVYLLPSQAVVNQGGTPFLYVVKEGVVHRLPVIVDVDDGKVAHVRLLGEEGANNGHDELTGKEEIVLTNQGELSEGQAVETSNEKW